MADERYLELYQGTQSSYDSLTTKNSNALYATTDTNLLYKGDNLISSVTWTTSVPDAASARSGMLYVVATSDGVDIYGLVNGSVAKITNGGAVYTAGDNIQIDTNNVISATDTVYSAGTGVAIDENNAISLDRTVTDTYYDAAGAASAALTSANSYTDTAVNGKQDALTAGDNITISDDNVISATGGGETYTAGENITISDDNVISATDTTYTAGENITISDDNVISATGGGGGETYTAGENITISADNVISAVDTTYVEGFGIDIGSVESYFTRLQGAYGHSFSTYYEFKMSESSTNTPFADSFSTETPYAIDLLSMGNGTKTLGCTTSKGKEFSITVTKTDDRYVTFSGVYGENTVADCISMLDVDGCDIAVLVPMRYTMSSGWVLYDYGVYMKQTITDVGTKYYLYGWGVRLEVFKDGIADNAISVENGILGEINNIATNVENLSVDLSGKQDTLVAGDNITISADNVISSTGGSGGASFQLVSETDWASTTPQDGIIYLIYTEG